MLVAQSQQATAADDTSKIDPIWTSNISNIRITTDLLEREEKLNFEGTMKVGTIAKVEVSYVPYAVGRNVGIKSLEDGRPPDLLDLWTDGSVEGMLRSANT